MNKNQYAALVKTLQLEIKALRRDQEKKQQRIWRLEGEINELLGAEEE